MRKLLACLAAAALVSLFASHADAQQATTLKPYVELILDTSGSMVSTANGNGNPTGAGPPSCGGTDNKLNAAKCAIENIANSYGDIEFGLARFRNITSGTPTGAFTDTGASDTLPGCCSHGPGANGGACNPGPACTTNDDMFEVLNPLTDDIGVGTAKWVNDSGNTCTAVGTDPEVWSADSSTPLAGALGGVKKYWQGLQATATAITTATETGTTATYTTSAANHLAVGEPVLIAGVSVAGYNGTFTVATITTATNKFTVTGLPAGLAAATGGTVAVVIFQGTAAQGFAPIANDPTNAIFLPGGCDPTPACSTNCCTTQCRPYITILLTDGQETCGPDDPNENGGTTDDQTFPPNAAAALLSTVVGADKYRIETKPIGFGVPPPAVTSCTTVGQAGCQIEDIAHAGGAPDIAGKLEGFYAADQAGVELAISQIIEGSVRSELCNNLDDDCDGKIDEDFPTKGSACNNGLQGACLVAGVLVCRADGQGVTCNAGAGCTGSGACTVQNAAGATDNGTCQSGVCVPTPGTEICNGIDDDCDGKIDEGLTNCGCIPQAEICDGKDNDCDGKIDEDTDVPCGANIGVCTAGVETCVCNGSNCGLSACSGAQPCGGVTPCVDICDGKDNDCDGVADGITQACSNMPANGHPAGDPANNPGDPGQNTGCDLEGTLCACHPGSETCPANGSGHFSACIGEVEPTPEACDGIDNDCDGKIDEGFVSEQCGVCGNTACVNGAIVCNAGSGSAEICNGRDDDCDGKVDEGIPDGSACGSGTLCGGVEKCVGGSFQCVGTQPNQESCNCLDDDCDGKVDENNGNCPSGSTCTQTSVTCECAFPCGGSEFPCPAGKVCDSTSNLCITDVCFGVQCNADAMGNAQTCSPATGKCVSACSLVTCSGDTVCLPTTGMCAPNNCVTFPMMCTAAQSCIGGTCTSNPCAGVTCTDGKYCEAGNCVASCAGVMCGSNSECVLGQCQTDPCGTPCTGGNVCHTDGTCGPNACQFQNCPQGQFCDPADGQCKTDPCVGTACPGSDQVCVAGTCYEPSQLAADAAPEIHVSAAGGGCDAGSSGGAGFALLLGAIGIVLGKRRTRAAGGAA